jgi:hypothetical protein
MTKKLNIITMNDRKPIEKGKRRKLTILTTNKIEAEARAPMKARPKISQDEIISTENVERHQKKLDAQLRMKKARKAKRKK